MPKPRTTESAELKARIALEAVTGQRTINEIAGPSGVHPNQVVPWTKQALAELPRVVSERRTRSSQAEATLKAQLYQPSGQLPVELDWLKKKLDYSVDVKRELGEPLPPRLAGRRQGELCGLSRRGLYDKPHPESADARWCLRLPDAPYTRTPSDGIRRMTAWR
jgi:transposase-like protein